MLKDHFTASELLAAADAADLFPPHKASEWAVDEDGDYVLWPAALHARYP